MLKKLR